MTQVADVALLGVIGDDLVSDRLITVDNLCTDPENHRLHICELTKAGKTHRMGISACLSRGLLIQHALFVQDAGDADRDQGTNGHQDAHAG